MGPSLTIIASIKFDDEYYHYNYADNYHLQDNDDDDDDSWQDKVKSADDSLQTNSVQLTLSS